MNRQTYWQNTTNPNNIARGLYIIFPFRYQGSFQSIAIDDKDKEIPPLIFDSGDFIELLSVKCRNGNFVKRFNLNSKLEEIKEEWYRKAEASKIYHLNDLQIFIFNNGIAFITTYFAYKNEDVDKVYQLINPGYVKEKSEEMKQAQEELLEVLEAKTFCFIKGKLGLTLSWFTQDEESKKYIIKEAYRLNVAALPNRFEDNEIPKKIAYNEHRLIDVTRDFTDESEKDVEYATGAKDVEDEHYGWACAITSQEISYAYGPGPGKDMPPSAEELPVRAEEDLLLTMIVMYQKYTCMIFNEKIHQRFTSGAGKVKKEENLRDLKREALEFVAYGTLAPSQISRWNNVCETYRSLQKLNGVNEALEEISQKINLLNEEQDRIDGQRESRVSMIITVFGLVSIVSAALQMLDYISTGKPLMIIGFLVTGTAIILFFLYLIFNERKKKRKREKR
ncbi:hypothetical protein [Mediterraneibacter faecis]|uniref:hypothetical protein n=1 Tax=Mediterraneibacter faecis TaxID=592978 RepID=UPI0018AAAD15|nr:hypothetical protein [Mediterraneibacter faecis]